MIFSKQQVDVRIKCENENTQNSITVANKRI